MCYIAFDVLKHFLKIENKEIEGGTHFQDLGGDAKQVFVMWPIEYSIIYQIQMSYFFKNLGVLFSFHELCKIHHIIVYSFHRCIFFHSRKHIPRLDSKSFR